MHPLLCGVEPPAPTRCTDPPLTEGVPPPAPLCSCGVIPPKSPRLIRGLAPPARGVAELLSAASVCASRCSHSALDSFGVAPPAADLAPASRAGVPPPPPRTGVCSYDASRSAEAPPPPPSTASIAGCCPARAISSSSESVTWGGGSAKGPRRPESAAALAALIRASTPGKSSSLCRFCLRLSSARARSSASSRRGPFSWSSVAPMSCLPAPRCAAVTAARASSPSVSKKPCGTRRSKGTSFA
mmetsp:Transcript_34767/g.86733  ORF Transcript_34767/g.86733 Transcript_34767/m.86733 type:complete len:243 (+) Transcript_34767:1357-2085(+)